MHVCICMYKHISTCLHVNVCVCVFVCVCLLTMTNVIMFFDNAVRPRRASGYTISRLSRTLAREMKVVACLARYASVGCWTAAASQRTRCIVRCWKWKIIQMIGICLDTIEEGVIVSILLYSPWTQYTH